MLQFFACSLVCHGTVVLGSCECVDEVGVAWIAFKQIPGKIMFGNGVSWTCLISLDLRRNKKKEYILERMSVQPELIEFLRDLPVAAGLAVRRDVRGVEEFYSLISGEDVKLERGFLDLTSLAVLAGYKFQSRNMTAMGVQVIGTLLNKNVSTGDDWWGERWQLIPDSLFLKLNIFLFSVGYSFTILLHNIYYISHCLGYGKSDTLILCCIE